MGRINIRNLVPTFAILTTSQNWTVPTGVYKIKVLTIGGGGGGGGGYSSTYVGGGGGSGALVFAELAVQPGTTFDITIGGGGTGGTGGSSPTAGGGGGNTQIQYNGNLVMLAGNGSGGGAATSTANGSAGGGGGVIGPLCPVGAPFMIIATYVSGGGAGSNNSGGVTPIMNPAFTGVGQNSSMYGAGGNGGGVNANGANGVQGVVMIWWGD